VPRKEKSARYRAPLIFRGFLVNKSTGSAGDLLLTSPEKSRVVLFSA
jgi:hypothetical protein